MTDRPDPTTSFLGRAARLKDALVITGIGVFGFAVGEFTISTIWGISWVFTGGSAERATELTRHSPGDIMGQWWEATKTAWGHLFH